MNIFHGFKRTVTNEIAPREIISSSNMFFPIVFCLMFITLNTVLTQSPCSWPEEFQDTIWHDSDRGEIAFSNISVTGWDLAAVGDVTVTDWDCYTVNVTGSTSLTITFKAQQTFDLFSTVYQAFACLTLETFSTNAYFYYLMSDEESRLNYDRIKVIETTILETFITDEADICLGTTSTDAPTANEYHLMIRNDRTETAIRDCPDDYFGIYEYTVNDGSSDYCTTSSSWNACTVQNTMQFNYSLCSTVIANSVQGIVSCLFDMVNVNYHLVTVLTKEISSTQRFSCFLSYNAGNGTLFVSEFPGSCRRSQTPFEIPVSGDGSTSGFKMILTETDDCIPTTTTTSTTTSTTTPTTTTTTETTTTTTPTTTTTTPTTTTTTPTTTTTTPTTTTTTPTTTTTTPTTTTTTPTTTTTTPTTTTTTPTTTTTTPTTTTTTPTTTTTTVTTTTTTAAPVTTQAPPSEDNTVLIFAVAACSLAVLLIILLLVIVIMRYCCRKKPVISPPKTPDIDIETMTHKQAGYGILPWGMTKAPARTLYDGAVPEDTDNKSSVSNLIKNDADTHVTLLTKNTTETTEKNTSTAKTVKVVDGIIIDENVNFAMRYSSRMMIFKKEWEARKVYDKTAVSEKTVYIPNNNGTQTATINTSTNTFNGSKSLTPVNVLDVSVCRSLNENDVSLLSDQTLPVSVAEST